jgi:anaerobic ribonucleoside-triphosphate reductase activating protein
MNYAQIRDMDITDGPGIRVGFYVQGCDLYCKGCYNYSIWDFDGGKNWTIETNDYLINLMNKNYIKGLSILGGDPLSVLLRDKREPYMLYELVSKVKEKYKDKTIWLWTGYTFEEIYNFNESPDTRLQEKCKSILDYVDVIVDGRFDKNLKNLNLKFCGSSNQRVIDVKKSLVENKVVLYEE